MDLIQSRREQESGCVISITLRLTEKEIWMDRDGESDDGDGEIMFRKREGMGLLAGPPQVLIYSYWIHDHYIHTQGQRQTDRQRNREAERQRDRGGVWMGWDEKMKKQRHRDTETS